MSSDNFYFTEGNVVYQGDASDFMSYEKRAAREAVRKYRKRVITRGNPIHVAASPEDAQRWAMDEYSEYGLWWIDGE